MIKFSRLARGESLLWCLCHRQLMGLSSLSPLFFQLQITGLSWNCTGSVIAASYPSVVNKFFDFIDTGQ